MSNIYDYIKNNNNEIEEINVVDAMILSRLSYVHIEEMKDKLPLTIEQLSNYVSSIKINSHDKKLIEMLSNSNRFKLMSIRRI